MAGGSTSSSRLLGWCSLSPRNQHPMVQPILQRVCQIMAQLPTKHAKVTTSSSAEVILGNYQPRGTSTIALGQWVPRARLADQDPHSLGRWSSIEFQGGDRRRIVIVSTYWLCSQQTQLGSGTYHDQQYRLLLSENNPQPNP